MYRLFLILFFIQALSFQPTFSTVNKYKTDNIPSSLVDNANAVIRNNEIIFSVESPKRATKTIRYAVTILNKNGDMYALFKVNYDKFRKIFFFSGTIYNSSGDLIYKVKNKDIRDISNVSGYSLYEDNRVKFFKPVIKDYPYTVEYIYEVNYNGLMYYPIWQPVRGFNISVENSSFEIRAPIGINIRYEEINVTEKVKSTENNGVMKYFWNIENFAAVETEPFGPILYEHTPIVYTALDNFNIKGYKGSMKSWKTIGEWQNLLNEGLDVLSDESKEKFIEMVKDEPDNISRVKKIYEYLQNNTRYVSIQLGIGGWQPFPASDVEKYGYGDCKALTNYTKSVLNTVGIESWYTLVKAGRNKNIMKDFPSRQFNHVILCVPIENDTIWLECTSQQMPFGFLGDFTCDRDVLLVTDEGGKLAHTPVYDQNVNTQFRNADVTIDSKGNGKAEIKTTYSALKYDNIFSLLIESKEEQKKALYETIDIPSIIINDFEFSQFKEKIPKAELVMTIHLNNYASVSGKRLFLPANLMNKRTYVPKEIENRRTKVVLSYAYYDADTIVYNIPESYKVEHVPENIDIRSEFGHYNTIFLYTDTTVIYIRSLKMNKGEYPVESYPELVGFFKDIVNADKSKIILSGKN